MTLWQGRVEGQLAPEVWELVKADDAELFPYDCEGTRIHARRLAEAGILSAEELAEAEVRLNEIDASRKTLQEDVKAGRTTKAEARERRKALAEREKAYDEKQADINRRLKELNETADSILK